MPGHACLPAQSDAPAIASEPVNIVELILDVMLPQKNGLDVCRDIRSNGIQIPIIMLTAKVQLLDKLLGLKLGADDYMGKPFAMAELPARVEAL